MRDDERRTRYLELTSLTEHGLRHAISVLRKTSYTSPASAEVDQIEVLIGDLEEKLSEVATMTADVRAGHVDVASSAVERLKESADLSSEIVRAAASGGGPTEIAHIARGLTQLWGDVLASCVYVCEDNVHEWPCGVAGRPSKCPCPKRWIQQIR